uniref:Innexin n=1 Tax=Panagrolaimus sp. ES5 TaxID=591445 RepID=A0AC34FFV7_9BILA
MFVQSTILLYRNAYKKFNNDSIDRLHQIVIPNILITLALIFLLRLLATPSIYCWENAFEMRKWNWYINSYCYIENLYFVSPHQVSFPLDRIQKSAVKLSYYPWIPVLLVFQAILCMTPHYLWEAYNHKTGILIRPLVAALASTKERARKVLKQKGSVRSNVGAAKRFLEILKCNFHRIDKVFGFIPPRQYLTMLYILYKFSNLIIITCQLLFLNRFLNTNYTFWGAEILWDLIHHVGWKTSGHFPRVVYCDFPRRDDATGKNFYSTTQCLLAFNLFNEVMYIGIWFLFSFLIIIDCITICKLLIFLFRKESYFGFVEELLKDNNLEHEIDRSHPEFKYFVDTVLGKDGILTLRLLSANSAPLSMSKFINELFKQYKDHFPEGCNHKDV